MTEEQIGICKTCLNRKTGSFDPQDICNLRGHVLAEEESCSYFDLDKSVITDTNTIEDLVRPNDQRAQLAVVMVALVMVVNVMTLVSSYMQLNLLQLVKAHGKYTITDLTNNDLRVRAIGITFLIMYIISGIVFIRWFRRAYYNLHQYTDYCEHSEGWAAGAWFVPIISIFRPYHIMKELWNETTDLIASKKGIELNQNSSLIGAWWTLWVITSLIGNFSLRHVFDKAKTVDDFITSTTFDLVSNTIAIPLGIVTILMIRAYAKREELLNQ